MKTEYIIFIALLYLLVLSLGRQYALFAFILKLWTPTMHGLEAMQLWLSIRYEALVYSALVKASRSEDRG